MSIRVVADGGASGPGNQQVPPHLTRIPIQHVGVTADLSDKMVKGKVVLKGPLVSLGDGDFILKTVIQEDDSGQDLLPEQISINTIVLGALAKDFSASVNQGDVLAVTGFTVGKSPTVLKDKLHPCNLHLSGDDACIYVYRVPVPRPSAPEANSKKRSSHAAEVSKSSKEPKYTYVSLADLTVGAVVNVYAVVVFYKQPFKTSGTGYCSTVKIMDRSNERVVCSIFCDNVADHPKILNIGDIIRLHRVKVKLFNGSISLLTTHGFSAVTVDGAVGGDMVPNATSKKFHFSQDDRRTVEELRAWAATQELDPSAQNKTRVTLSTVQPRTYFDLTCQLLAKAPLDTSRTLLKVWDGTKSPHTLLKFMVEPGVTEGRSCRSKDQENLTANLVVYDNHHLTARELKPGAFLRIYNLHGVVHGAGKVPGGGNADNNTSPEVAGHLAFHLHGGTSYGRGIQVLPDDCSEIRDMKRVLESFPDDDDSELSDLTLAEVWGTPPESIDADPVGIASGPDAVPEGIASGSDPDPVGIASVTTCGHTVEQMTLAQVKQSQPSGFFHVSVPLQSYQPTRLYQSLQLFCDKCKTMRNIPDDHTVAGLFSEAMKDGGPCEAEWAVSSVDDKLLPVKCIAGSYSVVPMTVYMPRQVFSEAKALVFLQGSTLEETCKICQSEDGPRHIVPIRSLQGHMALLDLSAPFLFQGRRGRKRYYGCKQCSEVNLAEPNPFEDVDVINEKTVAAAMGVQLLRYVLVMKLLLQDATDTLEALLYRDAELFFNVSAEEVGFSQEQQNIVKKTMDTLCPPGRGTGTAAERPWLSLCLSAYTAADGQTCYQICNTRCTVTQPAVPDLGRETSNQVHENNPSPKEATTKAA